MAYPSVSEASDLWSLRDNYKAEAGGTWPFVPVQITADYLLVAGGGAGGFNHAGGGGAGGMVTATSQSLSTNGTRSLVVTVGAGSPTNDGSEGVGNPWPS